MKENISAREAMLRVATRNTLLERLKHPKDTKHWHWSWQEFFDNYWGLIFRFARSLGLPEEEAKEVVQESVLCVVKKIGAYEYRPEEAKFSSWLGGIIYRKALKQHDKRKRSERLVAVIEPDDDDDARALEQMADPASDACQKWTSEWEWHLWTLAKEKVKKKVSDEQYQMFDLHKLQELTAEETADILGKPVGTVYSAASRVQALIKEEVERLRKQPI
jgi:RNA polymerase sigma-70 factor (ECF subfamily)